MTKSSEIESASPPPAATQTGEECKAILGEVEAILESAQFRGSQQCRRFLNYVVTHTLGGDDGSLRERVIGNAVFGRAPDYDTSDDPVVRLRASEVRKRLAQYYQSLEQQPDVRVLIPSGSYKATFLWGKVDPTAHAEGSQLADSHESAAANNKPQTLAIVNPPDEALIDGEKNSGAASPFIWWILPALVLAVLLSAGLSLMRGRGDSQAAVGDLWQPFISNSKPVLISVGSNAVYRVSDEVADKYAREHHLESGGMEFFPDLTPDTTMQQAGMHSAPDSFVALGDVAAISQVVSNLTRMQKPYQERFTNDISFAEIRSNPTVLVGGFNNAMTRELTKKFRFVCVSRNRIEDREQPDRAWVLSASQDAHDTEDYAIISRILPQDGSAPLLSLAGLGQYGTLAATEFVFDPNQLEKVSHSASKDWRNRNMQILLHIKVNDFKPGPGEIVATHTW
jgi:hypothetical protein